MSDALGLFALYMLPSIAALVRKQPNATGIIILNLLLGWTVLGWIAALIWAVQDVKEEKTVAE